LSKGAIFLGVLRGKISEGLDFADDLTRAVFVVGIPFPPVNDLKIKAKKEYLDHLYKISSDKSNCLKGQDWY
jgi:regulator of telomere elongation helicase 1